MKCTVLILFAYSVNIVMCEGFMDTIKKKMCDCKDYIAGEPSVEKEGSEDEKGKTQEAEKVEEEKPSEP